MENRLLEYIGSLCERIHLCVKILIVAVVVFVLLQVAELISFYINVNSGGLKSVYGEIFLYCFYGLMTVFSSIYHFDSTVFYYISYQN